MEVYLYSVRWYCDYGDDDKMMTSSGIVAAKNMSDATEQLTSYIYENVEEVHLYVLEGSDSGYADLNDINALCIKHNLVSED